MEREESDIPLSQAAPEKSAVCNIHSSLGWHRVVLVSRVVLIVGATWGRRGEQFLLATSPLLDVCQPVLPPLVPPRRPSRSPEV